MKFSQFPIQTHRENPANARSEGAALLVRGGYVSHSGEILPLGQLAIERIKKLATADRASNVSSTSAAFATDAAGSHLPDLFAV